MDAPQALCRTFLAMPIAAYFQQDIQPLLDRIKHRWPGIKWVRAEQIHLTFHFFGNTTREEIQNIEAIIHPIALKTRNLHLGLHGLGFFPNDFKPRILWIGMVGDLEPLHKLQGQLESSLKAAGFPIEDRPFRAHVTIGRIRPAKRSSALSQPSGKPEIEFKTALQEINKLILYQSFLSQQGPRYETLKTFLFSRSEPLGPDN